MSRRSGAIEPTVAYLLVSRLGVDIGPGEDGAFWLRFLRTLVSRGLAGVQLVISDSHLGLKGAIAAVLQGASWQRCRTHFMRNALCLVPKGTQQMVAATIRTVFVQPDAATAREQWRRVADLHGVPALPFSRPRGSVHLLPDRARIQLPSFQ